jgi:hypothetical protein
VTAWRDVPISIADDLFLVALDGSSGRSRLSPRTLSVGLAAALLAELNLLDHIAYTGGQIKVPSSANVPVAVHHRQMVDQLAAEPEHPVPTWLSFFAQSSADVVGSRLVARGFLRTETARGVLRGNKQTYVSTDDSALTWRTTRLANLISHRDVRSWEDGLLVGLVNVTGLGGHVLAQAPPESRSNVTDIVESVMADQFFHALLGQAAALIAADPSASRR